jgi:DNA polymerase-3 subunit delta'
MSQTLPWLIPVFQKLVAYKKNNKVPHGIILSGPSGIGKKDLAFSYAKFLLCEKLLDYYCNQCRSCQLFAVGNHPDFANVQYEEDSQVIKIDQVRHLVHFVGQTSSYHTYQVAVIHPAHAMNTAANNALLKTLEEPRGKVVVILVTSLLTSIPATIRSRCHIFKMSPPSFSQAKEWLIQSHSLQNVETFLAIADNLPLNALKLASHEDIAHRDLLLDQLLKLGQKKQDPVITAELLLPIDLKILLMFWISLIMDMIRIRSHGLIHYINNRDQFSKLNELSQQKALPALFNYLDTLYGFVKSLNNHINLNVPLLLEKLCILWYLDHEIS